jgi:hypothetical protein
LQAVGPSKRGDEGLPLCVWYLAPQGAVVFESEAAFLRRLKLLLPGEADQVDAEDSEPVTVQAAEA